MIRGIRLASADGPESTTIDADSSGTVIRIVGASPTVVEGFRLIEGYGSGGGILVDVVSSRGSPVIRNCISPAGSLELLSGPPTPGSTASFVVRDRGVRRGARAALLVGTARDPSPCGTPASGGRLLVDLARPHSVVLGNIAGSQVAVGAQVLRFELPSNPMLIGTSYFVQGMLLGPFGPRVRPGPTARTLLEAVQLAVGPGLESEPSRSLTAQ